MDKEKKGEIYMQTKAKNGLKIMIPNQKEIAESKEKIQEDSLRKRKQLEQSKLNKQQEKKEPTCWIGVEVEGELFPFPMTAEQHDHYLKLKKGKKEKSTKKTKNL